MTQVVRKFDEDFPVLDYTLSRVNYSLVHRGQMKLYLSELEFYGLIMSLEKKNTLEEFLVVYIGSAAGYHTNLFLDRFEGKLSYLLYDPNKFAIDEHNLKYVTIRTGDDGFFTDAKISEVLEIAKGRRIIYMCDIRLNPTELNVWNNMKEQQRWGIMMNADYMLLKLRFPYTTPDGMELDLSYDFGTVSNKVDIVGKPSNKYEVLYLDGDMYFQIYPTKRSTEGRLFVVKGKDGKYKTKVYNFKKYEEQMNYYNTQIRNSTVTFKNAADISNHIPTYLPTYENIAEYYVIYNFLTIKNRVEPKHADVVRLMYENSVYLMGVINDDHTSAMFSTLKHYDLYSADVLISISRLYNTITYFKTLLTLVPLLNVQVKQTLSSSIINNAERIKYLQLMVKSSAPYFDLQTESFTLTKTMLAKILSKYKDTIPNYATITELLVKDSSLVD